MTAPNHIVRITLTGICGGFMGINILENYYYLVLIVFAAQLPDIDHTKSIIGLTFYPIAKYLNRSYGHHYPQFNRILKLFPNCRNGKYLFFRF